ncbi:uncharacterized protein LOC110450066 [Mizuhopecten yessoensis]|uniref:Polyketide synthase 16 n=1 Tax=Mizuhopecten yessoensis TaxID=6573 RepID=A0A210QPZ2_MIZYE|nr:uncharacterized protein LOC110450066 [Mizuhopecten yessoensis]OWF50768.1 polyketide synthase 16 [Mizuhopecten yessoensis]
MFKDTVDRLLTPLAGWSIFQTLIDGFEITDPLKSHLAIFTCQVALTKLWNHFGIKPDVIVGQSVGEVAAAYAAGVLSLEDAVKVIYERSSLLAKATGGTMCVVGNCYVSIVAAACKKFKGKVSIAVHSSEKACTLSGDRDAIEEIKQLLGEKSKDKLFLRQLNVQCAYHSQHMQAASEQLECNLIGLEGSTPACTLISTVTGERAGTQDFASPEYWGENVRQPVLFHHAITKAQSEKTFNVYLEIGPRPILRSHLGDIVGSGNATTLPSMTENKEWDMLQLSLMELYRHGIDPQWPHVVNEGNLTDIPKCLFNPIKLLFESDATNLRYGGVQSTQSSHLFVERAGRDGMQFKINISPTTTWFLYEHVVSGTIMVPGAFYIDVALEVCKELAKKRSQKNLSIAAQFIQPLRLSKGEACKAEASVEQFEDELSIHIYKNNETVAKCQINKVKENPLETVDLEAIRRRCTVRQTASQTYQNLKRLGFAYGKDLKILGDCLKSEDECLVNMTLSDTIFTDISSTHLHPSILDGLLQTPGVLNVKVDVGTTLLPGGIESIITRLPPERKMLAFASLVSQTKDKLRYNALLLTEDGRVVAEVRNFFILCIGANNKDEQDSMYQIRWEEIGKRAVLTDNQSSNEEHLISVVISLDKNDTEKLGSKIVHLSPNEKYFEKVLTHHLKMAEHPAGSIILSVDKEENLDKFTGEEVMQRVAGNASTLLHICQLLVKLNSDIPVLIITEETQSVDKSHTFVENVIGSELWGMARTIVLEYPLQLTLIDRHVPLHLCSSIIRELLVLRASHLSSEAELLVTGSTVYCNRMIRIQEQPGEYRWISLKKSDQVHLKSYHPDDVKGKFCLLQEVETIQHRILMEVDTAVMHDKSMFPLTVQSAENDVPIWTNEKEDGFDIITFEVSGRVALHSYEKLNVQPKQLEGSFVACSPFTIQSTVEVPKDCMMRIDDLPSYRPGMLRLSALLWQMKDHIKRGKTLILTDSDSTSGQILQSMLSKPLASQVVFVTLDSLQNSASHQLCAASIVILTAVDSVKLDNLLTRVKGVHTLNSLEMFATRHSWQSAKKKHESISFKLLKNEELLNRKVLSETVPKVARWLRRKISKINFPEEVNTDTTVVQLISTKQQDKLVKVTKKQLFRKSSCYVIVGGLTGLGWEIVQFLAKAGAGSIVTLSRSHSNTTQIKEISKLEKTTSTSIKVMSADITNIKSLEKAFDRIDVEFGRNAVQGIFHGGAVLNDGFFTKQTDANFIKVLLPKVLGSWNLHVVSKRYDLDFFILHSSMTSIFGNKGQSNYSAGNAFMDSLAHYRARNGLPGLSINWGPLAVGMAKDNALQKELERIGYMYLDVKGILDTLEKMLMLKGNQVVAGIFDWSLVERQFTDLSMERVRRRFRRVMGNDSSRNMQTMSVDNFGTHDLKTTEGITDFVIEVASRVFAVDADMINSSTSMMHLGIDSMVAMTFVNTISGATNCSIPIVLLLSDETTIGKVVDYIEANMKTTTVMDRIDVDSTFTDGLTHMEKEYFKDITVNPEAPGLFIYVDFEVSGRFADQDFWRATLKNVVQKHPALRTRFVKSTDSQGNRIYTRVVTPAEDIVPDVRVVKKGEMNKTKQIPPDLEMYKFDPESDLPLRLLYEDTKELSFIRIVFSHLTFDMTSTLLVLEDMDSKIPVPLPQDITKQVNAHLQEEMTTLETYWKNSIPDRLLPITFADNSESYHYDEETISTVSDHVPQQSLTRLVQFCRNNGITPFQLMATAYQILLHLQIGVVTACILTFADMRMHFPHLQRELGCMVNKVPLFLTPNKDVLIGELLTENGKEIRDRMNSSLYPFDKIVQEVSARQVQPASVFRHMIIYRDIQKENTKEQDGYVNVLNVVSPNHRHETSLIVWNYRNTMTMSLELEYNTLAITKSKAEFLLHSLIKISEYLIDQPESTFTEMTNVIERTSLLSTKSGDADTRAFASESLNPLHLLEIHEIISGEFIKQTRNGWTHPVKLSVCSRNEADGSHTVLKWEKPNNKRSRNLDVEDINSVERTICNGLQTLLVGTGKRRYTFMTSDKQLYDRMTGCLLDGLKQNGHNDFQTSL